MLADTLSDESLYFLPRYQSLFSYRHAGQIAGFQQPVKAVSANIQQRYCIVDRQQQGFIGWLSHSQHPVEAAQQFTLCHLQTQQET